MKLRPPGLEGRGPKAHLCVFGNTAMPQQVTVKTYTMTHLSGVCLIGPHLLYLVCTYKLWTCHDCTSGFYIQSMVINSILDRKSLLSITHHRSLTWLTGVVQNNRRHQTDSVRLQQLWDLICLQTQTAALSPRELHSKYLMMTYHPLPSAKVMSLTLLHSNYILFRTSVQFDLLWVWCWCSSLGEQTHKYHNTFNLMMVKFFILHSQCTVLKEQFVKHGQNSKVSPQI